MAKARKEYNPLEDIGDGLGYSGMDLADVWGDDFETANPNHDGFIVVGEFRNHGMSGMSPEDIRIIFEEAGGNKAVLEEMTIEEVRSMLR